MNEKIVIALRHSFQIGKCETTKCFCRSVTCINGVDGLALKKAYTICSSWFFIYLLVSFLIYNCNFLIGPRQFINLSLIEVLLLSLLLVFLFKRKCLNVCMCVYIYIYKHINKNCVRPQVYSQFHYYIDNI